MRCDADADADADAMCIPIIGTPWGFEANGCALEPYTFELPFAICTGWANCHLPFVRAGQYGLGS